MTTKRTTSRSLRSRTTRTAEPKETTTSVASGDQDAERCITLLAHPTIPTHCGARPRGCPTAVWIVRTDECYPNMFAEYQPALKSFLSLKNVPGARLTMEFDTDDSFNKELNTVS